MSKKDSIVLRLKRGKDGRLLPVVGVTPTLSIPVKILPMTYGESRSYESFGENVYQWSDEDKMTVINAHILEPEISIEDVEDMSENFDPWTIEDLVASVFVYSGMARLFEASEGNVEAEETDKVISA